MLLSSTHGDGDQPDFGMMMQFPTINSNYLLAVVQEGAHMTAENPGSSEDDSSIEDPFAIVGNEIRAEIIRIFGDRRFEQRSRPEMSFSEIQSAISVDIHSSQFNYHLQRLVGNFLEGTDDGYQLRPEGHALYKTLIAGTFDRRSSATSRDAGFECHFCPGEVKAIFEAGLVRIVCPDCAHMYDVATIPPGAVEEEGTSLAQVARYNHHKHLAFARGTCPTCGNRPRVEMLQPQATPFEGDDRGKVAVHALCEYCSDERYLSVGEALLADSILIAFCHDHGLDVLATPLWELEFAATDRFVTVHSTDPWRVGLDISLDSDTLELIVDESLTIIERVLSG
ncbi:MAG: ArsR family transcriptional regulator [Halobacteriaceae archaeon]